MKTKLAVAAILLCIAAPLRAQETPVMQVIVVRADNPAAYIKDVLETGTAHQKRLGSALTLRVWRASFAGTDAGTIVVAIEYPSLTSMAADIKKLQADSAYMAWLRSLDKVRKVVSNSVYTEAK